MRVAAAVSEPMLDRTLTKEFGSTIGAVYGAAAEMMPATTRGWGMPFGTALWLGRRGGGSIAGPVEVTN
jgi:hypothetical protein